jgi:hypothetical protein
MLVLGNKVRRKSFIISFKGYRNLTLFTPVSDDILVYVGSARNIAVKVQLMCGEEETHALPVIFGKSSCPEYTTEAYTTVSYHNK